MTSANVATPCKRGSHQLCDSFIHGSNPNRWFCACLCHPTPNLLPPLSDEDRMALNIWAAARANQEAKASA